MQARIRSGDTAVRMIKSDLHTGTPDTPIFPQRPRAVRGGQSMLLHDESPLVKYMIYSPVGSTWDGRVGRAVAWTDMGAPVDRTADSEGPAGPRTLISTLRDCEHSLAPLLVTKHAHPNGDRHVVSSRLYQSGGTVAGRPWPENGRCHGRLRLSEGPQLPDGPPLGTRPSGRKFQHD